MAGFWQELWHGVISPMTLVLSLLKQEARISEVHNSGSQYDLGFPVGLALGFRILGITAGSRRRL